MDYSDKRSTNQNRLSNGTLIFLSFLSLFCLNFIAFITYGDFPLFQDNKGNIIKRDPGHTHKNKICQPGHIFVCELKTRNEASE